MKPWLQLLWFLVVNLFPYIVYLVFYARVVGFDPNAFASLSWVGVGLEFLAYLRCIPFLSGTFIKWRRTQRLLRKYKYSHRRTWWIHEKINLDILQLISPYLRGQRLIGTTYSIAILTLYLCLGVIFSFRLLVAGLALYLCGVFAAYFASRCYPGILYLAKSGEDNDKLQLNIIAYTRLRVISLLTERSDEVAQIIKRAGGSARLSGGWDLEWNWPQFVNNLCKVVFVVVIDAREISSSTIREAKDLFISELAYKTIFVAQPGKYSLLNNIIDEADEDENLYLHLINQENDICAIDESYLSMILEHIVLKCDLPTQQRTTARILSELLE